MEMCVVVPVPHADWMSGCLVTHEELLFRLYLAKPWPHGHTMFKLHPTPCCHTYISRWTTTPCVIAGNCTCLVQFKRFCFVMELPRVTVSMYVHCSKHACS